MAQRGGNAPLGTMISGLQTMQVSAVKSCVIFAFRGYTHCPCGEKQEEQGDASRAQVQGLGKGN